MSAEMTIGRRAPEQSAPANPSPAALQRGAALAVRGLSKRYGRVVAVDGVSLEAGAGDFLALLGPSGSGKTTILMTIAGFEQPDEGDIQLDGRTLAGVPPYERGIGMVFQRYALFPHLTVMDNVEFPLRMRRTPADRRRRLVQEALELVRLSGLESRQPAQLSGGQQQRVALARAIVYQPRLLLMDEPLGALDKKLREHMQRELRAIQHQLGTTVVYVTHDQGEALTMADRIAVLSDGRLEQLGSPTEIYERPSTPFVAGFVGETNLLQGRLRGREGRYRVVEVAGGRPVLVIPGDESSALVQGCEVSVAVRPERIRVMAEGDEPGALSGTVADAVYEGSAWAYDIALDGGETVRARVLAGAGGATSPLGARVTICWSPDDALVWATSGEDEAGSTAGANQGGGRESTE